MCKRIAIALLAAIALATLACGVAEGPREKLKHSAFVFNEGLRWGRIPLERVQFLPETLCGLS